MAKLYVKKGEHTGKVFEIKGEVTFGRLKTCTLMIADEQLSRKHTRIYQDGSSFLVEDMESRNGTFVNGKKVQKKKLSSGDVISLGNNEFVFENEEDEEVSGEVQLQGKVIQNYEIRKEIFTSPLFLWHQGWQKTLERKVAFQILNPLYGSHSKVRSKVFEESKNASRYSHPHLFEVFEVYEEDPCIFICTEDLHGLFLKEALEAGTMDIDKVLQIGLEMSSMLSYVHQQGQCHGSMDPFSIFLSSNGISKALSPGLSSWTLRIRLQGKHGSALLPYTAPEIWQGKNIQPESDCYALGILLFRALTGKLPFSGKREELKEQHLQKPLPSLSERVENCPPKLDLLLQRMTDKNPQERMSSTVVEKHFKEILSSRNQESKAKSVAPSTPPAVALTAPEKGPSRRLSYPGSHFSKNELILFLVFLGILFFLSSGITRLILTMIDS